MKRGEIKFVRDTIAHMINHGEWYQPDKALDILDAALAAPEPQQPVGMVTVYPKGGAASCLVEMSDTLPPEGLYSLYTAPVAAPQPVAWTSVKDAMPKSGVKVLACYKNSHGNLRRIRAEWTAAKTVESNSDYDFGEYDEETDAYWSPEGWYECIEQGRQWMRFVITSPERLVLLAPGAVGVAQVFWRYGFERKARLDMLAALPGSGLSTLKMLRIMLEWAKANGAARFNLDADTGVDFAAFSKRLGGTPVTTTTYEIPLR